MQRIIRKFTTTACLLIFITTSICFSLPKNYDPDASLIFTLGGDVSTLNPILATDSPSSSVIGVVFSGLIRIDKDLNIIPDLAEKWKISKDGKTWTFYLRDDVFWHDGEPFTAEDVKFTIESVLDEKVNSVRRSNFIINGEPVKVKVIDKHTIAFILPEKFAPFLSRLGMEILPKHLLYGKDINTAEFNKHPIGTGPFIFKEWLHGDHVTVERNPKFYRGSPLVKNIIFKVIPNEKTALLALETGQVDETSIPPKDYKKYVNRKDIKVFTYDNLIYTYLGFNLDHQIFKDRKVRQALAYATDKKQLIDIIFLGMAKAAYCPQVPIHWAYSEDVYKFEYDPEKAKELLEEAGWIKNKKGILTKNINNKETPFEFTCLVNRGNKQREKAAILLQQQYKKLGIKMKVQVMEWSSLVNILNAPKDKKFDAVIIGWSLALDPDAYSTWHSSQYPRGFNFINYKDKEVDKLLEEGRVTLPKNERKKIYGKLYKLISRDQPYIFLWYPKSIVGVRSRVKGLSPPTPAGLFLNIEKVYIVKEE